MSTSSFPADLPTVDEVVALLEGALAAWSDTPCGVFSPTAFMVEQSLVTCLLNEIPGCVEYGFHEVQVEGVRSRLYSTLCNGMRVFVMDGIPLDEAKQPYFVVEYEMPEDYLDREILRDYPDSDPSEWKIQWKSCAREEIQTQDGLNFQFSPCVQTQVAQWRAGQLEDTTALVENSPVGARRL